MSDEQPVHVHNTKFDPSQITANCGEKPFAYPEVMRAHGAIPMATPELTLDQARASYCEAIRQLLTYKPIPRQAIADEVRLLLVDVKDAVRGTSAGNSLDTAIEQYDRTLEQQ